MEHTGPMEGKSETNSLGRTSMVLSEGSDCTPKNGGDPWGGTGEKAGRNNLTAARRSASLDERTAEKKEKVTGDIIRASRNRKPGRAYKRAGLGEIQKGWDYSGTRPKPNRALPPTNPPPLLGEALKRKYELPGAQRKNKVKKGPCKRTFSNSNGGKSRVQFFVRLRTSGPFWQGGKEEGGDKNNKKIRKGEGETVLYLGPLESRSGEKE